MPTPTQDAPNPITGLSDEDLASRMESAGAALQAAQENFNDLAVERFERAVVAAFPGAVSYVVEAEQYENGPFLTAESILDADGNDLAADSDIREALEEVSTASYDELTADLTTALGTWTGTYKLAPRR